MLLLVTMATSGLECCRSSSQAPLTRCGATRSQGVDNGCREESVAKFVESRYTGCGAETAKSSSSEGSDAPFTTSRPGARVRVTSRKVAGVRLDVLVGGTTSRRVGSRQDVDR